MTSQSFSRPGAVDLSGMAAQTPPPGDGSAVTARLAGQAPAAGGSYVIDVTDETFQQDVVQRSLSYPVVIDLWADWCEPCKQLSPILEKLAGENEGRFLLAKVDVDANPQISAAFQVQSIPSVFALLRGQPVPLFQGALPEAQVRDVVDQLLQVAVANGVSGRAEPVGPVAAPVEGEHRSRRTTHDSTTRTRRSSAATSTRRPRPTGACSASRRPTPTPRRGSLRWSCCGAPPASTPKAYEPPPTSAPTTSRRSLPRRISTSPTAGSTRRSADSSTRSRRTSGDDRDRVRTHLIELFEVVGAEDPRVTKARAALARVLF